ncbi:MAG: TolC family protein [Bacteroidetes bacterium]|nr:TolC family protein [Bacteroidota bacterium]
MKHHFSITWILLLTLLTRASAQVDTLPAIHHFSVSDCAAYGESNNVQVKNALLDYKIQEQVNRNVKSAAYPQINGNIGPTFNPNVAVQSFPNFIAAATYGVLIDQGVRDGNGNPIKAPADYGYIQAAFGSKWNANVGLTLSQILFDGQLFIALKAEKTTLLFKTKSLEVTKENIRANIYKLYYQLAASKTQVAQIDANITRAEKLLHDVKILYQNGFQEKLDVDKATVQLNNLQTEKSNVENTISNGYYGLKLLMGMPISDSLILTDSVTSDLIKNELLNEGNYSYENRPDYQLLQVSKKLGEFNVSRYKLSRIPTFSLSASFMKSAQRNSFDFFSKGDWFTSSYIGMNINIPLFDGFAKASNIRKSQLELEQTVNQIEGLKQSIDNDVAQSKNNYRNAVASMDLQKTNMQLAESVYEQTKKKYEIGTGSTTEIANAQADLRVAQSNYINALYNAIIAKIDFEKAAGIL